MNWFMRIYTSYSETHFKIKGWFLQIMTSTLTLLRSGLSAA